MVLDGCVEEWHIAGGVASQTEKSHQCQPLMCHSSTLISTSGTVTARDKFYQAFPRISTASDEHWDLERQGMRLTPLSIAYIS